MTLGPSSSLVAGQSFDRCEQHVLHPISRRSYSSPHYLCTCRHSRLVDKGCSEPVSRGDGLDENVQIQYTPYRLGSADRYTALGGAGTCELMQVVPRSTGAGVNADSRSGPCRVRSIVEVTGAGAVCSSGGVVKSTLSAFFVSLRSESDSTLTLHAACRQ